MTHPVAENVGPLTLTVMPAARERLLSGREPLTYSPVVAATASRLRRLFPARPATG